MSLPLCTFSSFYLPAVSHVVLLYIHTHSSSTITLLSTSSAFSFSCSPPQLPPLSSTTTNLLSLPLITFQTAKRRRDCVLMSVFSQSWCRSFVILPPRSWHYSWKGPQLLRKPRLFVHSLVLKCLRIRPEFSLFIHFLSVHIPCPPTPSFSYVMLLSPQYMSKGAGGGFPIFFRQGLDLPKSALQEVCR